MKMTLLNVEYNERVFRLELLMDEETRYFDVLIKHSGSIEYLKHDEKLNSILFLNVHNMMKLNHIIKDFKNEKPVVFPIDIGEF
jgi:hypothetical protein